MTLKFPFVTEKAMVLLENQSKLQFLVTREATKGSIKREIEKAFGQKVSNVRYAYEHARPEEGNREL